MSNLRKGFYCILCNGENLSKLQDVWSDQKGKNSQKLFISQSFCKEFVEKTITSSYHIANTIQDYLDVSMEVINCKTPVKNMPEKKLKRDKVVVNNCYRYHDQFFFYFCEDYCENFDLIEASTMIEGDLPQMRLYFNVFDQYRFKAFDEPNNNLMADGVEYEKTLIQLNFETFNDIF
jgi:transcription elongation factor Elf1